MTAKLSMKRLLLLITLFFLMIGLVGLIVFFQVTGLNIGFRSVIKATLDYGQAILGRTDVKMLNEGDYTNIIFLHHSVGRQLIDQGNVRQLFSSSDYNFWDQDYNDIGLRNPEGAYTGYSYWVPDDNTDINGFAHVFSLQAYDLPVNALSGLLQHEVILIKSCFPNSNITSDAQLETNKKYYLGMRETMKSHPEKIFIILTQPPLNPAETNLETAARARQLASWLASEEFTGYASNVFTFDFFELLAVADPGSNEYNMLRPDYRIGRDSHPSPEANAVIGPQLVNFVIQVIEDFRQSTSD